MSQNEDLRNRLSDLETRSIRHTDTDTYNTSVVNTDNASTAMGILDEREGLTSQYRTDAAQFRFAFDGTLEESRVYRRARLNECDVSFRSSIIQSHAWSQLSGLSFAQISVASVLALPVSFGELVNARFYTWEHVKRQCPQLTVIEHLMIYIGFHGIRSVQQTKPYTHEELQEKAPVLSSSRNDDVQKAIVNEESMSSRNSWIQGINAPDDFDSKTLQKCKLCGQNLVLSTVCQSGMKRL